MTCFEIVIAIVNIIAVIAAPIVAVKVGQYKLLEAMAISLGHKDRITWETIQNPYIPIEMVNTVQQQQMIQSGQALLADFMPSVLSRMIGGSIPQNQVKAKEEKPDVHA